jgi:hypothetical protein
MAGLVPAIHVFISAKPKGRGWPETSCAKTRFALLLGHDEQKLKVS